MHHLTLSTHRPRAARRGGAFAFLVVAIVAGLLSVVAPATASVAAPTGLTTSNDVVPVFQWDRVPGAAGYTVQVSSSSSFSSSVVGPEPTTNNRWTPMRLLPSGVLYWRVQAVDPAGATGPWTSKEVVIGATTAPTPVSPVGGVGVLPPTDPPVLTWTVVPGATGYEVELDPDGDWIGSEIQVTRTNSLVWPDPQEVGDYFWRVRAQFDNNIVTAFSSRAVYQVEPLPDVRAASCPAGLACAPNTSGVAHPEPTVEDVVLDWDPVLGALRYELRVGLDRDFNNIVDTPIVSGTRFSPPTTYANNGFFWQVRAINAAGKATEWPQQVNTFSRRWLQKPTLLHPSGTVGDDFYYQWSPVQHASQYELQVGHDPNFTPNSYAICSTDQTTFVAGDSSGDCMPTQGSTYYWRVVAIDNPSGVRSLYSSVGQFVYDSGRVTLTSPASNATVSIPTLQWSATPDTQVYEVEIRNNAGLVVASETTSALSWTPNVKLDPGAYRWTVQSQKSDGGLSPRVLTGRAFTLVDPTYTDSSLQTLTGNAEPASFRFPVLSWSGHPAASYYRLRMSATPPYVLPDSASPALGARLEYPAVTDWGTRFLQAGTYQWWVEAYDENDVRLRTGATNSLTIKDVAAATNRGIALDGLALDAGTRCTVSFSASNPGSTCENVPATPVLDWDPVPSAGGYEVLLAEDPDLTTLVQVDTTQNSRWNPRQAIADNESRPAYYWYVRPCKSIAPLVGCTKDPRSVEDVATNAFRKLSPKVELTSPAADASFANEVSFSWRDYRSTNTDAPLYAGGTRPSHQSGQKYRIQVSTTATFGNIIDAREVDQTTYTSPDTYPEGDLWWRVQAIDGSGNNLAWSQTRRLKKATPVANLDPAPNLTATERASGFDVTTPSWNQHLTSGGKPFTWTAAPFDGMWNIEVYRNDDTTLSSSNLVLSLSTRQAAFTWSEFLPPANEPYRWRIRRTDVNGQDAQWSDFGRFFVDGVTQQLVAPSAGGVESPNGPLFRWTPVPQAASYRVEVNGVGNPTAIDIQTAASTWATTANLDTGAYQWRVTPRDANVQALGTSAWRAFSVDAALRATVPAQIQAPNGTGVGNTLTSSPPVWSQDDVAMEYQWLRDGSDISGAGSRTYLVTADDYAHQLTLLVRGTKPGYATAESTSNALTGSAGGAIVATSAPVLKGTGKVGETLSVLPGTWSETAPAYSYQWLRNGVVIPDVTAESYQLVAADAATVISVRVFADQEGLTRGNAVTNSLVVGKLASSTSVSLSARKVKPKKKVKITVAVEVADVTRPVGTVKFYDGSKLMTTVSLTAARAGHLTLTWKKFKKGKHKVKAVYSGGPTTNGSTSKLVKLVVKR